MLHQVLFIIHSKYPVSFRGLDEDYYIHWSGKKDSARRVEHHWGGNVEYYLANPSHKGFREYISTETIRRCKTIGFDGTFFDVGYFPLYNYNPQNWFRKKPYDWPVPSNITGEKWNKIVIPYWKNILEKYHLDGNNYIIIVNCGRMITGWYAHKYLDFVDGGMSEGWMTDSGEKHKRLIGSDWLLSASRILEYLTGNRKILIAQTNESAADDLLMREWWIGNYFLLKNSKSFYYYEQGEKVKWWPEYEINLGKYLEPPPKKLDDLKVTGTSGLYKRKYEHGLVLVNPSRELQNYKLTKTYFKYSFSGGGQIRGLKKPKMTLLRDEAVSDTVIIKPGRALILWR